MRDDRTWTKHNREWLVRVLGTWDWDNPGSSCTTFCDLSLFKTSNFYAYLCTVAEVIAGSRVAWVQVLHLIRRNQTIYI